MYLMTYLDEETGKVVYTLKARARPAVSRGAFPCARTACSLAPAEDGPWQQAHRVGTPGTLLAGRQVLAGV